VSPGQLDSEVIRRHLQALDEALQVLRRHQGATTEDLRHDRERQWVVEHGLQLCAQNVLDVATHLAASAGLETPDYATAVDKLGELGVVPTSFAERLRGLAGFRDVLVHGYLDVDLDQVARLLRSRLDDFVAFAQHVDAYVTARKR
jgi:uncharacterized protein YutE (UPF0331/DUF86 family)